VAKPKRQQSIPGTEPESIKELDDAAESYVEARDERIAKLEVEVEAKEALVRVMKKHKLEVYRDESASPPLTVTLTPGADKVKVTAAAEGDDDDGQQELDA